jgi:hypothetical protein
MVSFKDQNPAYTYEVQSQPDITYKAAENDDADLGNFFSRPIKLDYAWGTGISNFSQDFNPWTEFFENDRVINRISNFNNLRCKLHVKFLINGNGFHFGRLLVNYKPLHTSDDFYTDRAFSRLDNVAASQRPHIYLDPTTSSGGDMILPFFWPKNYLNIPSQDWRQMGEISIRTLQDLQHANGASDIARISVFIWAEDVTLSIPTSSEPGGLTPQAGEDEYGKGPISRPASVVARVMGKLTNVPYIGNYARATEIAADAMGAVATMFGYARPNNLSDIQPYRPTVMGNLANVNYPDSAVKLSLDCKQELTVDPATVGLSAVDEMTIKSIACRESWLTSFNWSPDSTIYPPETALFNIQVTPHVWNYQTLGGQNEIHFPACGFIAQPFANWRGTMKYRFQVVSSNYHKGRLKIVYDPYGFQSNEYNTNYTHIIDIAEEKDFTVEIGWGSSEPYKKIVDPTFSSVRFSNGAPTVVPLDVANGMLAVYVVNDMTVPSQDAANLLVGINVFVSAGDDIEFRNPTEDVLDTLYYFPEPQSGEEDFVQSDKDSTEEPSKPMQTSSEVMMMNHISDTDPTDHVFFGESIVSIRSLMKRYQKHESYVYAGVGGYRFLINVFRSFPFYPGYAPSAITSVLNDTQDFNFCHNTFINYFSPAFKGWRGGLRWKLNPTVFSGNTACASHTLSREQGSTSGYFVNSRTLTNDPDDIRRTLRSSASSSLAGAVATNSGANPCLEAEVPYQIPLRFSNARVADLTSAGTYLEPTPLRYSTIVNTTVDEPVIVEKYVSIGEDFSLFFFVGAPIMYTDISLPPINF